MNDKNAISGMFHSLTGASKRHNKALRDTEEWATIVQKFLNTYDLFGTSSYDVLLDKVGEAKIDLTTITYNGRPLTGKTKNIRGGEITPLVSEVLSSAENLRRFLINPQLQSEKVDESVRNLRSSYEKLQETLSGIEYM